MKIKPTSKKNGVLVKLSRQESQLPSSSIFELETILVPVDFSDCSKKALQYAIPFAKQFGAELILMHVVEPYVTVPEMGPIEVATAEQGEASLKELQKTVGDGVHCYTTLRTGMPCLEIVKAAQELRADLIVISTHGRRGLTRVVFGSTTEKVVRHAPCPVLIVRESEREFVQPFDLAISKPYETCHKMKG